MGGFGSGRRANRLVPILEDRPRLRLAHLKAVGLLQPGASGIVFTDYTRSHERRALWVSSLPGWLLVGFMEGGHLRTQNSEMQEQPCHFGGSRFYMTCQCGHRCKDLYLTNAGFVCRRCSGSIYKSQTISAPHLKAWTRIAAIHAKLGLPKGSVMVDLLPERPKRMRFVTYYAIAQGLLVASRFLQQHLRADLPEMLEKVDKIGSPCPRKKRAGKPDTDRVDD